MKNLFILLGLLSHFSYSQSTAIEFQLNSASDFQKTEALQTSWAIGEIFTETFEHHDGLVTMGINNNNVVYIITGGEHYEVTPNVEVFPVPFTNKLFIQLDKDTRISNVKILDLNGKEVKSWGKIEEDVIQLDTNEISPNIYFLTIHIDHTLQPIIFKIIKK